MGNRHGIFEAEVQSNLYQAWDKYARVGSYMCPLSNRSGTRNIVPVIRSELPVVGSAYRLAMTLELDERETSSNRSEIGPLRCGISPGSLVPEIGRRANVSPRTPYAASNTNKDPPRRPGQG